MDRAITTRLPEEFILRIKELARKENLDTSAVIRRLLARALEEQKYKAIIEMLENHKISIGKAAEELNISIWEIMDIVRQHDIKWPEYDDFELLHDLEKIGYKK